MLNNKKKGTEFEQEFVAELQKEGYWVHFLYPDPRGAQPFDIIAVRNDKAYAIDCKTSALKTFPVSRLEDNQITAFEKWMACGSRTPIIAVKYGNDIYLLSYRELREKKRLPLKEGIDGVYRWQRDNGAEPECGNS